MRLSIITLTIDTPPYLDEAIGSIERDAPIELEHIVVYDGHAPFLADLTRRYPAVRLVAGQGRGATAAAALGVEAASGDFILFLHSDDRLCRGALARLAAAASERPDVKIWTGGARIFRAAAHGRETTVRLVTDRNVTRLALENVCDDIPLLSARFCHRSVFAQIGNFDPRFSESSDRELLLRAVLANVPEASLGTMVSEMRLHEESRTIHQRRGQVPPYLAEHVEIANAALARPDLPEGTRGFLRNWRAREILRLAVYQWRAGERQNAATTAKRAEVADPFWIFRIISILVSRRRRNRLYEKGMDLGAELPISQPEDRTER